MFVEFHTRSAFSFLAGASLPEDLVQRCADLGHAAVALTDRDNLCGAPRFYMAAKKIGMKAHLGAEITGADGDSYALLAENRTGYRNLCRLMTSMKLRAPKGEGVASLEELRQFSEGLVCLTAEERELFDALTAVRHKTTVMEAGKLLARNAERYVKTPRKMAALFRDVPEAIAET